MFIKIVRKMSGHLNSLVSGAMEAELPSREAIGVSRADADGAFDDEVIDNQ
jgi:N-acetyltransferase 10